MKVRWLLPPVITASVAACSSLSALPGMTTAPPPHCPPQGGMELVIGAHKNAPEPLVPAHVLCQLAATIRAGKPVRIVVASGQPRLAHLRLTNTKGGSLAQQDSP